MPTQHPWDKVADALISGLIEGSSWATIAEIMFSGRNTSGPILLERTGPFMPPITFPNVSHIVVSDHFKQMFEVSGFQGATFRPVIKSHIVELDWPSWDWSAKHPPNLPPSKKAEDYIRNRPHSPEMAELLGTIWEVKLRNVEFTKRTKSDWFRLKANPASVISQRLKDWLEMHFSTWVKIEVPSFFGTTIDL